MPDASTSMPTLEVIIDGTPVTVTLTQGDYVRAEVDGFTFSEDTPLSPAAVANLAFHAVKRSARKGLITIQPPDSWEDFLDAFELNVQDESDNPGNS